MPVPIPVPATGNGTTRAGPRRPDNTGTNEEEGEEGDRSMMTIGEESVDLDRDGEIRGGPGGTTSGAMGRAGGDGGDIRLPAAGQDDEEDEEEDDVELRMAIEASRAALGM